MLLSNEGKKAALEGIAVKLNLGAHSSLSLFVGDTLSAEFALPNPVQLSIIDNVMTFNLPPKVLATVSGKPTTARLLMHDGTIIGDLDIATEVIMDKPQIYAGGYVELTALSMQV